MTTQTPRGPRPPVTRETPEPPASEVSGDGTGQALPPIEAHGAIEIREGQPAVPVEAMGEPYDGRWAVCRKPFKLNGEKYTIGDDVPLDLIPRPESWVRTGYLKEAS